MKDVGWNKDYGGGRTNGERADMALKALRLTTDYNDTVENDIETYAGDLIANLMHLCRRERIDFDSVVDRGRMHHDAERRGIV